jgi:bifunctional DNA-binding transcriptional regulator/antitoxin component of YhaV-PrlF toxin-antitoxin module
VAAAPHGVFRVAGQGFLFLPAPVRHWCGLAPGDRVLLVADPGAGWLVVHPPAAVDAMVGAAHEAVWGGEPA